VVLYWCCIGAAQLSLSFECGLAQTSGTSLRHTAPALASDLQRQALSESLLLEHCVPYELSPTR